MRVKEIKADKERLLELIREDGILERKIEIAYGESRRKGALHEHDYGDTWRIIHPKSGKPFEAHSHWFNDFGTDEEKEKMRQRRIDIEQSICAEERKRRTEIQKEIFDLHVKYNDLCGSLEYTASEDPRYDGENFFADILGTAQYVLEKNNGKLQCFLDGLALCIVEPGFINLQESDAIFLNLTSDQVTKFREFSSKRFKKEE